MVVPLGMAKDSSYQVSSQNSKNKGNFQPKNLNFRRQLLNKLSPLVPKCKIGIVVPPGMAKDHPTKFHPKTPKTKATFGQKNVTLGAGY